MLHSEKSQQYPQWIQKTSTVIDTAIKEEETPISKSDVLAYLKMAMYMIHMEADSFRLHMHEGNIHANFVKDEHNKLLVQSGKTGRFYRDSEVVTMFMYE